MTTRTFNVSLSPELARFVRERVDSGLFTSASEVVREALRWFVEHTSVAGRTVPTLLDLQEAEVDRDRARRAVAGLRRLRRGTRLGPGLSVQELRDAGRR